MKMSKGKALIAMSGGVDSSVAAALMVEEGYECIGITMKLHSSENSCCTQDHINDASKLASELNFPYQLLNFTENFNEKVIDKFVWAYEHGLTPNPCIECNRYMKFELLHQKAKELGYDYVVTGHYARVEYDEKRKQHVLKKALDPTKDQSYVLYSLTRDQLASTLFPLGNYTKTEVRAIASKYPFINANKAESQDICFIPDGDYGKFIRQYTNKEYEMGDFVDKEGKVLGQHKGLINYTVGQRKGLGLSFLAPLYVCATDPEKNQVIVGLDKDTYGDYLEAENINLIIPDVLDKPVRLKAKIRYKHKEAWALVERLNEDSFSVRFEEAQRAITKGQALVLYDGDLVVGGGTIR